MKTILLILGMASLLSACVTTTPSTAIHQPMSARPEPRNPAMATNGAIYQVSSARPLFEDRRARFVGDIITINVVENVQASKKSGTTSEKTQTISAGVPTISGLPFKSLSGLTVDANNSNKFNGKGENSSAALFTSTITVTVIEVLSNGNLLVAGEKQIGLKEGEEFVRFSGVINPNTITTANTVQSTQIADARIEYKANGFLDDAQSMGWLSRFFLSYLPF